jgi:hypothetical protein
VPSHEETRCNGRAAGKLAESRACTRCGHDIAVVRAAQFRGTERGLLWGVSGSAFGRYFLR